MQVQKEEIRQSIINAAIEEFKEKDYLKASMKSIATRAGVAVGNIYRYFKSKEELLEIVVKPAYDQIVYYIHHHDHPDSIPINEDEQKALIDGQLAIFQRLIIRDHDALLVLVDHSAGTKYANAKNLLLEQVFQHVDNEIDIYRGKYDFVPSSGTTHAFCVAMIEGMLDLARNHKSEEEFSQNFKEFMYNLFAGFLQQMK